jgi:hypothetical protein
MRCRGSVRGGGTKPCTHKPTPIAKQRKTPAVNPSRCITPNSTLPGETDRAKNCKPAPSATYEHANTAKNSAAANQQSPPTTNIGPRMILLMACERPNVSAQ